MTYPEPEFHDLKLSITEKIVFGISVALIAAALLTAVALFPGEPYRPPANESHTMEYNPFTDIANPLCPLNPLNPASPLNPANSPGMPK